MIKVKKVVVLSLGLVFVSTLALAQTVEVGSNAELHIGKDVAAAHASHGKAGIENGNVEAGGEVADGGRVGDSKFQSHVHGKVSVPAAYVAGALAN